MALRSHLYLGIVSMALGYLKESGPSTRAQQWSFASDICITIALQQCYIRF